MMRATACGCDTYTAWLLLTSTTVAPARFDISRCASGGSILSLVVSRYQLGFAFHAASLMVPPSAFTPKGTCESAMNAASSGLTSPANDAGNFAWYRRAKRRILDQRGYRFALVERKGSDINQPRHL